MCAQSNIDGCKSNDNNSGVNMEEAIRFCEDSGSRLCSAEEVFDGVTKGSGCNNDYRKVWTATPCANGYISQIGRGGGESFCSRTDERLSARCCADAPTISQVSAKTCDSLSGYQFKYRGSSVTCSQSDLRGDSEESHCISSSRGQGANLWDSLFFCASVGARLCTIKELEAGLTKGSGCSNDFRSVWSSTVCTDTTHSVKGVFTMRGDGTGNIVCTPTTRLRSARCCADQDISPDAISGELITSHDLTSNGSNKTSKIDSAGYERVIIALAVIAPIFLLAMALAIYRNQKVLAR